MSKADYPVVTMTSGHVLQLRQMRLVEEAGMIDVMQLRAQAAKALGPTGTMMGVFGQPGIAFAAETVALGLISSLLNQSAQKTARENLERAQSRFCDLRKSAAFFDVEAIENIGVPNPSAWGGCYGTQKKDFALSAMGDTERSEFCKQHNLPDQYYGYDSKVTVEVPVRYIHDGDDFISAITADGEVKFRWSHVESYRLGSNA